MIIVCLVTWAVVCSAAAAGRGQKNSKIRRKKYLSKVQFTWKNLSICVWREGFFFSCILALPSCSLFVRSCMVVLRPNRTKEEEPPGSEWQGDGEGNQKRSRKGRMNTTTVGGRQPSEHRWVRPERARSVHLWHQLDHDSCSRQNPKPLRRGGRGSGGSGGGGGG